VSWALQAAGGIYAGIGSTMAPFIANLAISPDLTVAAKSGVMLSAIASATIGIAWLCWLSLR